MDVSYNCGWIICGGNISKSGEIKMVGLCRKCEGQGFIKKKNGKEVICKACRGSGVHGKNKS